MEILAYPIPCLVDNSAGLFCGLPLGHGVALPGVPHNGPAASRPGWPGGVKLHEIDKRLTMKFDADAHVFKKPAEIFGPLNTEGRQLFSDLVENLGFWAKRLDRNWEGRRQNPALLAALSIFANTVHVVFQGCKTPADVHHHATQMASFL